MNYDYRQTPLSRSLFGGLLAGLVAVTLNTIFDFVYRGTSGFALSEVVNIPSIIFASLIVAMIGGVVYFLLRNVSSKQIIYIVLFMALTILGIFWAVGIQRTPNAIQQHDFRILFGGVVLITGLCTAFLVPYFARHDGIYNEI